MIRINLLPQRRRARRLVPESGVVAVIFLVITALAASYLYYSVRNSRVNAEIEALTNDIIEIRPKVAEVLHLQALIDDMRAREDLLKSLEAHELPWAEVLADLVDRTPRDVWLASVSFNPTGQAQLALQGSAFSYDAVGRFMTNLAGSRFYNGVDLQTAQESTVASREVVQFALTVVVRPAEVVAQGGGR